MFIIIAILWIGFKIASISYAFLFAVLIGIVDIFPILGTGTVIIPWALFCIVTGDIKRAVILLIVYAVCLIPETGASAEDDGRQYGNLSPDDDFPDLCRMEDRRIRRYAACPYIRYVCD